MVDMAAIGGLMSSLNAAVNIGKTAMELRDATAIQSKVIDLNRQVLAALDGALAAKSEHLAMLDRIRDLEQEIARLRAWEGEKQRYELKDVYIGSMAYALKASDPSGEPAHWLCAACYQDSRKSILQPSSSKSRMKIWRCPGCKHEFETGPSVSPSRPFVPVFKD